MSGVRMRLRSSPPSLGSLPSSGRGMPPAILPPIFVGGGRPGEECASGLPPIGPRRVAIFRKGDAAGNPHPKFYSVVVVQGEDAPPVLFPLNLVAWPSLGKGTPPAILPQKNSVVVVLRVVLREEEPPLLLPPNLVTWPSSGRRTLPAIPPQYLRRGGRPGGGCISGPPPAEPRRVAIFWEGDADRSAAGCASGTPPAEPRPVAIPREGDANGDPPAEPLRAAVVWGEDAQLAFLLPNLVT